MTLTFDFHLDALADGGRDAVGGDAEVGVHVGAADLRQLQERPRHLQHCGRGGGPVTHGSAMEQVSRVNIAKQRELRP